MGIPTRRMRSLSLLLVAGLALALAIPTKKVTSWVSHGEETDASVPSKPAITADMINEIKSTNPSFEPGFNENSIFNGATLAQAKTLMGTLQHTDPSEFLPHKASKSVELPTEFDWRTDPRSAKCPSVKEIRDQANCGSCWAFGSVEAMTDRICIQSNASENYHLSAQDVASCDIMGDMGCSGGVPSTVYSYYKTNGIVTGGNYGDKSMCWSYQLPPCAHHINGSKYKPCPDEVKIASCGRKCADDGKPWEGDKKHGTGGYSVCGQGSSNGACADKMAQDIYQNGPITGMFFVHQDFLTYKSGVYKPNIFSPMLGGHAIKIMGFGTENGTPYWLVANSWNEAWGDKGYFKIVRGKNACQIEDAMINGGPVAGHFNATY